MTDRDVLAIVSYSVVGLLVLLSNSIVIIVIVKSRELHLPTIWNIAFMAAWDFTFGLYFLTFVVPSKILNTFAYSKELEPSAYMVFTGIVVQNIFNILIALVDRYISVCWPLHYLRLMSAKRFALAVSCLFLINIFQIISYSFSDYEFVYDKDLGIELVQSKSFNISIAIIPMSGFILVSLLVKVNWELRKGRRSVGSHHHDHGRTQGSTQFTYTMFLSATVYLLSYLPAFLSSIFKQVLGYEYLVPMYKFSLTCILCNSFWNVFIYASTYKPFRDASLKLFCPSYSRKRAQREVREGFQRNTTITTIA